MKHQPWIVYQFHCAISLIAKVRDMREPATMNEDDPFDRLTSLLRKVHRRLGPYFSADDLESLGIELSGMDIETGRPADSGPQFCDPYPSLKFNKLFKKVSAYPEIVDEDSEYSSAFGIGMDLDHCLDDMGMFFAFNPSKRICAYRARP